MSSVCGIGSQQAQNRMPEWQERELTRQLESLSARIDRIEEQHKTFEDREREITNKTIGAAREGVHRVKISVQEFFKTLASGTSAETSSS